MLLAKNSYQNSAIKSQVKVWLFLPLFLVFVNSVKAQAPKKDSLLFLDPTLDIEVLLPPLDSLYIIGVKNNPRMKMEMAFARSYDWNVKHIRWLWAQNVSVFYNYSFGNLPFFAGAIGAGGGIVTLNEGYRAGINISLSVYDVLGHRGRVNEVKEKAIGQRHKHDAEIMEYKRQLALFYADMVGYNRLFKTRNYDLYTQTIACQVAEKEYKEGTIHISEFARQKNVLADAQAAYDESYRFFLGSLEQFEALLGVPLHTVTKKVR